MKTILSATLFLLLSFNAFSQIKVGQRVTNIPIQNLLNAPLKQTQLSDFNGKVILLEFWATYCGPCITAMSHLQELQKECTGKLRIITVTSEKESRIKKFIENKPSNLWFAVDSANLLQQSFPLRTIPESVLIDKNGVVVAITEPQNITKQVIADVMVDKKINLPLKDDNMVADPYATYFPADSTTQSLFVLQPEIKGLNSSKKNYNNNKAFYGRRLTIINFPLMDLYRIAYGDISYRRVLDLTSKSDSIEARRMYCMDIIVPTAADLLPTLKRELKAKFDLQADFEKRTKQVYVLTIADASKIGHLKPSTAQAYKFSYMSGNFNGQYVQLKDIASYIEKSGIIRAPILDETNDSHYYDIAFTYLPEKKGDFENVLLSLGLQVTKTDRDIDMLVFK
ncbi:redoxin family protein [Mucilaginibacter sp. L196]|uniref:redoxin family protein n=1 Tax=Mucilaginibacter sp. L196 TaxID=1641870 RepID=UPI00131D6BAE|nr:redoxin family protein [Mucilaginibacter sp. L196]